MTPEAKPSSSKRRFIRRIETQYKNTLKGLFEIGLILTEAKATLDAKAWNDMINNDLPFARRTAEKYIKIAADPRLANPDVQQNLPPKWTTLHAITFLDDEQFDSAIKSGVINPDAERKDIETLCKAIVAAKPKNQGGKAGTFKRAKNIAKQSIPLTELLERDIASISIKIADSNTLALSHDFEGELAVLCKKHGLTPKIGGSFKRLHALAKAKRRLAQKYQEIRKNASGDVVALVEAAFFQLETRSKFDPLPDGSFREQDLRNRENEFSDFDLEQLYGYCLDLQLLTKYTPLEFLDVQSFCDLQFIQCCTGNEKEQSVARANLEQMRGRFAGVPEAMLELLDA